MEIKEMKLEDVQTRKAELVARREAIAVEMEAEDADLDALAVEAEQLNNK